MKFTYFLSWFFICAIATRSVASKVVMCYYGSWAHYRQGEGKVKIEDLNPHKCTHIIYTFAGISGDSVVKILDNWLDIELGALNKLTELKEKNNNLKIMVAIGGWNQGSINFSKMSAKPQLRKKFVKSVVKFMEKWKLDGFDLDWEYPASRDGSHPEDKKNFIKVIQELKKKFKPKGWILTAAVGATNERREQSYDVKSMSKYLDYINVMAYDLHSFTEGKTGFNAPLYESSPNSKVELDVQNIMNGWIKDGAKPKKLVMGLGFYGKSYKLANPSNHGVGAATTGAGDKGEFTKEAGILSYLEICKRLKKGWTRVWDDKQKVPYAFKGNQWVGYDDVESLKLKVDLANKLNLAGVMFWSIEQDDVKNVCGDGEYPLLSAVHDGVMGGSTKPVKSDKKKSTIKQKEVTTTTTTASVRKVREEVEDSSSIPNDESNEDGFQPDPEDCTQYYWYTGGQKFHMPCPPGTAFDKDDKFCNFEHLVSC